MSALRVFIATMVLGLGVAGAYALSTIPKWGTSSYYAGTSACDSGGFDSPSGSCADYSTEPTPASWQPVVGVLVGFAGLGAAAAIVRGQT
jgi:hypothetical protein